jgi:hypothetical protein
MIKEEILELASAGAATGDGSEIVRECLQAAVLRSFHESGAFASVCLKGMGARRFAEGKRERVDELGFALFDKAGYAPERWLFKAQRYLRFMGFDTRIAFTRKAAVHAGWLRTADGQVEVKIRIELEPVDRAGCATKVVEVAGECFAVRYDVERNGVRPH